MVYLLLRVRFSLVHKVGINDLFDVFQVRESQHKFLGMLVELRYGIVDIEDIFGGTLHEFGVPRTFFFFFLVVVPVLIPPQPDPLNEESGLLVQRKGLLNHIIELVTTITQLDRVRTVLPIVPHLFSF